MKTKCNEIKAEVIGTITVMDYADNHPEEYFDHTVVTDKMYPNRALIVSEFIPDDIVEAAFGLKKWHDLPNGWQRINDIAGWVCRKGNRYIIITD